MDNPENQVDDLLEPEESAPRAPRGLTWLWSVIALIALAAIVLGGLWAYRQIDPGVFASSSASPSASSSAKAAPVDARLPVPTSCRALYTGPMWKTLTERSDLKPNPDWYLSKNGMPEQGDWMVGNDRELDAIALNAERYTCAWVGPSRSTRNDIVTAVFSVSKAEAATIVKRLNESTSTCIKRSGGTRCTITFTRKDKSTYGETYFVRDTLWIATKWQTNIDGYTASIVTKLFG